jgi:predicted phage tail protein
MTKINLHGILAFEFGNSIEIFLRKPKEVFNAIDANKKNFYKRVMELSEQGLNYSIIVDGFDIKNLEELEVNKSPKVIDLVPIICGRGPVVAAIGAAVAIGAGYALGAGLVTTAGAILAAQVALSVGIGLLGMGIQMMLAPKPENQKGQAPEASIGTASALNQSFYFTNRINVAQQGVPVPLGYGRLRIGSYVIQNTITSHSHKLSSTRAKVTKDDDTSIQKASRYANIDNRY